jgi:VWFA-related protein
MRTTIPLILLASLAQTPSPQAPSAQPPITFKVEVNYVEIDANVTDAQGNFARGLTRDDFQVLEDGKPQALTAFSMVDIPIARADPPLFSKTAIVPDVATNNPPFEGRVFVLVMDDLNTRFNLTSRTRAAARQFVERYVGANDMIAVVNTSGYARSMQDFTSNRQLALKAIEGAMGNKADSATSAALQDYYVNQNTPGAGGASAGTSNANAQFNELQRYTNARNTMHTLKNVADYMSGMRGRRKAVVFFSEGVNYNVVDPFNNPHATDVQREIRDLIAAATRANVNVYSVDPRGVVTGMEDAIELGSFPTDNSIKPSDLMSEMRIEQDSLRTVAEETGGFAVLNQNDFRSGFSRILQDNSSYYVLGYYPTNDKRDGRSRTVQVKVLKPGLTVRSRKSYIAPIPGKKEETKDAKTGATSPELHDALESPVAVSGLAITAFAAPFRGPSSKAGALDAIAMAIEIDGSALKFTTSPQGLFLDDLEVTTFASGADGKVKDGSHDVIKLSLKPQTHAAISSGAFRVIRRIQIPPGKYQLRVGVRESNGGRVGTVIYDLDAPDFSKGPLSMSAIALASGSGSRVPTASPDPSVNEFKDVLPAAPTASRDFTRGDTLALFTEIYDNIGKTPHRVEITATVLADDGKVVHTTSDERKSDELHGSAGGGYGYTTQIPLTFAPGRYVLRVSAKPTLGAGETISREVEFRVR